MTQVKLFATSGSMPIARPIFCHIERLFEGNPDYHIEMGVSAVSVFHNQNIEVQVDEVRGRIVTVIHTQAAPVSDNLVELFALLDALKRAQAGRIILVFPYMPYSRSDRKDKPRISVMSKFLADVVNKICNIKDVVLVDPHDAHLKHYFDPDADEIPVMNLVLHELKHRIMRAEKGNEWVLAFADAGASKRYEFVPDYLGIDRAYIHKIRKHKEKPKVAGVVGEVGGKRCILIDDEVLTGSTVKEDAVALKNYGAKEVWLVATHAIFMATGKEDDELIQDLADSAVDRFIISDTIPVAEKVARFGENFTIVSASERLAESIKRKITGESLSALHDPDFGYSDRRAGSS